MPYLEGVLNPAEAEEVEELLRTDSGAAEELAGIEEAIGSLRAAYRIAGHGLPEAVVTPDELLKLVYQADDLSPDERKSLRLKLADSPSAQREAVLLRELDQEMARAEAGEASPGSMPEALRKAFLANHGTPAKEKREVGWWPRLLAALGTLNPKPFVAVATCLVALCFGMVYTNKNRPTAEPGVATMTRPSPEAEAPEPLTFGVRVSDSENPEELRKQARQLLDHKVKYAVKGEGLYVTSDEETRAREALEQLKSPPAESTAKTDEPQAKEVAVVVPERYKSRAKMAREEQLAEDLDAPQDKDAELLPAVDYTRRRRVVAGQMDDGILEGDEEEFDLEKLPEPVIKPRVPAVKKMPETPKAQEAKVAAAAPAASQPGADQFADERDQTGNAVSALKPKKSVESEVRRDEPANERAKLSAGYQGRRETAQTPASETVSGMAVGETSSGASYHANAPRSAPVASAKPNVVSNIGVEDSLGVPGARASGRQSGAGAVPQVAVVDPVTSLERDFGVTIQVQSKPGGGRIITVTANQSLADDQVEAMRDRLNTALKVSELDSIVIHHLEP